MNAPQQEILMQYMDQGGPVYFEGSNIGQDHDGTDFLSYFGLDFAGQGQLHTGISSLIGQEDTFADSKNLSYQLDTYADIHNNWFAPNGGQVLFRSQDNHIRTIYNETENYRTIASSYLIGAVIDEEDFNTKKNLVQTYLAYLTNTPGPDLLMNQTELDLGISIPGQYVSQTLLVQNLGNNPLNISNISSSNPHFQIIPGQDVNLNLGHILEYEIAFQEEESGFYEGEITFNTNDPQHQEVSIPIQVSNFTSPELHYPESLTFNYPPDNPPPSFELSNTGQQSLTYWIEAPQINRANGGPDIYGYSWIDSEEDGLDFIWNDITEQGTEVDFTNTDDYVDLDLPFAFPFYGQLKNRVLVSTNGYLTFGQDGIDYSNDPLPSPFQPNDLIAVFWDDLNGASASIYHFYDQESGNFIVQYQNFPFFNGSGDLNFQVQLSPNGDIYFYYDLMEGNLYSATIGIENSDATAGLQVIYNGNYLTSYQAIKFSYNAPWLDLDKWQGEILTGQSQDINVILLDVWEDLLYQEVEASVKIHTNDPNNELVEIPLYLQVFPVSNDNNTIPVSPQLIGNYPNPFNPETTIEFYLPQTSQVSLEIFDLKGRLVKKLLEDDLKPGHHSYVWKGMNEHNHQVASGIYLYRLRNGSFSSSRKMILLK